MPVPRLNTWPSLVAGCSSKLVTGGSRMSALGGMFASTWRRSMSGGKGSLTLPLARRDTGSTDQHDGGTNGERQRGGV
jgi:hypothetical protein